jgi:hypothetical protein
MKIFHKKQFKVLTFDINYVTINEGNILKNKKNCLIIDEYCLLKYVFKYKYELLEKIDTIFIDLNFKDEPFTHLYFFLGKTIYYNYIKNNNENILKKIMTNPTITGLYNIDINCKFKKYEIKYQNDIENEICHIDVNNILKANNDIYDFNFILKKINLVWSYFLNYNIYNLPKLLLKNDNDIIEFYNNLMKNLGSLCICHPVNDKTTKFSYSRDIKFIPDTNRFFTSNNRQPLHNDFAYYPYNISPDWILLMSLQQCEYGGFTSIVNVKLLTTILEKYNKNLLDEITDCVIKYKYEDVKRGSIISKKKLLIDDNIINWNYFQIKTEFNDEHVIKVKNNFYQFLEKVITDGQIFTYKKIWNRGDATLSNDHLNLHQRSSFLGSRWLKDFTMKDKNLKLKI